MQKDEKEKNSNRKNLISVRFYMGKFALKVSDQAKNGSNLENTKCPELQELAELSKYEC